MGSFIVRVYRIGVLPRNCQRGRLLVSHSCEHYFWFVNSVSLCPEDLTSRRGSRMIYFKDLFKLLEDLDVSKKTPLVCKSSQVFWTQNHYVPGP